MADLLRIVGLDARTVNLMEAAGLGSLHDLRGSDLVRLTKLLSQVNRARSLVDRPPAAETVQRWVDDAKENTLPKVRNGRDG